MATGAEILSYKGNAENAGGYSGDGGFSGFGADSLNPLNRTLDNIAQRNTAWNMMQYRQKVDDRDKINEAIAQNKIDFEVDDIYRPNLEEQIEKIKQIRLGTPDIKSNPTEWNKLQGEIQKFQQMAASAKTNTATLKGMIQDYATNTDQRYRQTLGQHIEDQRGKGILHNVQPYQKMQDWTPSLFGATVATGQDGKKVLQSSFAPKELGRKRFKDANNVWLEDIAVGSDLSDFDRYYSQQNFGEGENRNLPDEARVFYQFSTQDPDFMSEGNISFINSRLESINEANNLKPGDPRYLSPIAVTNSDGTIAPTQNPIDFVKKVSLAQNYQLPKAKSEVDKDYMAGLKTNADINQSNASAESSRSTAAKNYWEIAEGKQKLPYELDKMAAEAAKFRREKNETNLQGLEATRVITQLIEDSNKGKFFQLNSGKVSGPDNKPMDNSEFRRAAGVSENAEIKTIPLGTQGVQKGMRIPVIKDGKVDKSEKPLKAYMIRDGQDIRFVGVYPAEKKGDPYRVIAFNPETLATSYISTTNNFVTTDKDQAAKEFAVGRLSGIFNPTQTQQVTETVESESTSNSNQTKSIIKPGTRKTVASGTYEYDGNGWFPVQ